MIIILKNKQTLNIDEFTFKCCIGKKGKTYNKSKYANDYKIKVSDIRLAAKEILGIEIMTENIKF